MLDLTPPVSPESRDLALERLGEEVWDLLVVGGGISGVAVARDAALRGLRVALVEAHDIAFGTSSRSSRLIHGGLRYLKSLDLGLVREGVVERRRLLRTAPGLVQTKRFIYLVYCEDPDSLWKIRLGVRLYGLLALGHRLGGSTKLTTGELAELLPGIETDCLDGAVAYQDCAAHDARLTLAVACSVLETGAPIVTRCRVDGFLTEGDRTTGALVTDLVGRRTHRVEARVVALCTGPWQRLHADVPPRIRTARGTHISVPAHRLPTDCFLALRSPEDGRQTFALPFGDHTVLGTTDDADPAPPAEVRPTTADTDYLLGVANHAFPGARLTRRDVVGAWAGLRPLVAEESSKDTDALSRRHHIARVGPGRWVLAGGKLTTHRRMAEDTLDAILRRESFPQRHIEPCRTSHRPLFASDVTTGIEALERVKAPRRTIERLIELYGDRLAHLTVRLAEAPPVELAERLAIAQARLAAEAELALTLDDVLLRRMDPGPLDLVRCVQLAPVVARAMAEPLGWNREQMEGQIEAFRAGVEEELRAARGD